MSKTIPADYETVSESSVAPPIPSPVDHQMDFRDKNQIFELVACFAGPHSAKHPLITSGCSPDADLTRQAFEPGPLPNLEGLIPIPQRLYARKSSVNVIRIPPIYYLTDNFRPVPLCSDSSKGALALAEKWEQHPATQSGATGQKIQLRLEWPGYGSKYTSLNFKDFKKNSGPVAYKNLMERVTSAIRKMMQELEEPSLVEPGLQNSPVSPWRIGKGGIGPEDVFLLSIEQISKGSWQPQLYIKNSRAG